MHKAVETQKGAEVKIFTDFLQNWQKQPIDATP